MESVIARTLPLSTVTPNKLSPRTPSPPPRRRDRPPSSRRDLEDIIFPRSRRDLESDASSGPMRDQEDTVYSRSRRNPESDATSGSRRDQEDTVYSRSRRNVTFASPQGRCPPSPSGPPHPPVPTTRRVRERSNLTCTQRAERFSRLLNKQKSIPTVSLVRVRTMVSPLSVVLLT